MLPSTRKAVAKVAFWVAAIYAAGWVLSFAGFTLLSLGSGSEWDLGSATWFATFWPVTVTVALVFVLAALGNR